MHQLLSIAISHDGFSLFGLLMINYTQLIPSNAEQKLQTMIFSFACRCWCMAELPLWSSMLRVIVMHPLSITGHDNMEKTFLFCHWSSCSHVTRRRWYLLASTRMLPNVLAFESFLMLLNISKLLMILQVHLVPDMNLLEVMTPIFCL